MSWRSGGAVCAASVCVALFGCGSSGHYDPPSGGISLPPPPDISGGEVNKPLDSRPARLATTPPPSITGGTLLVTHDGKLAVAADPDRDLVSIVSIPTRTVLHTIRLQRGDEPGRLVEDADGRVHVSLRKAGELATIDLKTGDVLSRRAVCGAPRGLAFDAETDQVHVACSGGELVSFLASGGDPVRSLRLEMDLRDVLVKNDGLFVSRFKTAELLKVDTDGSVLRRASAGSIIRRSQKFVTVKQPGFESQELRDVPEMLDGSVAWRTIAAPDGNVMMLHQYALAEPIVLDDPKTDPVGGGGGSAYGAPMGMCGGIVQPGVSTIDEAGKVVHSEPISAVLTVDAAVSPDSSWVALAAAGTGDDMFNADPNFRNGRVLVLSAEQLKPTQSDTLGCMTQPPAITVAGQVTAVAFNPRMDAEAAATNTWIVVQTREPAGLGFVRDAMNGVEATVSLSGESVYDTGHEIFHRDAGAGIACASCHAEGEEDGRVWEFDPIGPRRTQAVDVGLAGTAPFHWDGDMNDFNMLVEQVFMHRMGGANQTPERREALSRWVFALEPRKPLVDASDEKAQRGKVLFESSGVGCTSCHQGDKLTSNVSADVGTTEPGHKLQVPSLRGIAYRAPFLHDGRASTLKERFDPKKGGGDAHGRTSQLSSAEVDDLVTYLESL